MKHISAKQLLSLLMAPVFTAGACLLCGGIKKVPRGVRVYGVEVGEMTRPAAVAAVRSAVVNDLKGKSLNIYGKNNSYKFVYPEISFRDDVPEIIEKARKNGEYFPKIEYYLNGLNEVAAVICNAESRPVVQPHATFSPLGEPFTYSEGRDGYLADFSRLTADIKRSLGGGFEPVTVYGKAVPRSKTLDEVREETALLSSFTTYFDKTNLTRSHNIFLAASMINGATIEADGEFSFNARVGERTVERGFLSAKIIENGEFVEGVGGGVCQVSTTLYNAAVLAGLTVTEYHPHSLSVSYVAPSRDAMVSGVYSDLKFKNNRKTPIYIRAQTGENFVKFLLYGKSDGNLYSFVSEVVGSIPPPVEYTADEAAAREGREGLESRGYLEITKGGISRRVLVRKDKYAPVKRVEFLPEQQKND